MNLSLKEVARRCSVEGKTVSESSVRKWIRDGVKGRLGPKRRQGVVRLAAIQLPMCLAVTELALQEFLAELQGRSIKLRGIPHVIPAWELKTLLTPGREAGEEAPLTNEHGDEYPPLDEEEKRSLGIRCEDEVATAGNRKSGPGQQEAPPPLAFNESVSLTGAPSTQGSERARRSNTGTRRGSA